MKTALAALGWPASLTGAGTPASHRHSPTCRFQVMTGRGLCAGVALSLHKVCGETAAGHSMRRADVSGSTPVPGALGLRVSVLSLLCCWERVWM